MKIRLCQLSKLISCSVLAIVIAAVLPAKAAAQSASQADINRRVDAMLAKLTLEQKIDLIGGEEWMFIRAVPEIGLPRLKMSDGPMGVRSWGTTSGYAAGIGLAASWDTELAQRLGAAIGQDARARGVNFLLGPGVNIYRAPVNGRNFEYYGEDPYLAGRIAVHYIQGVQSQGVVATVKHYAGNNSEYDRHNVNSVIDERTLREIYLPAFEAAVKEGHVGAVMDSYNLLNGEHATQNAFLNTKVLKEDWGFRGILMSDWFATYDGVAAANSGLDLEMPFGMFMNRGTLLPAVQSGKISAATIDDKVRRILRVALEYGWLDRDQTDLGIPLYSQQSRQTALESAEEGIVLLKNEGHLLPLDRHHIHSIAMIGPNAYPAVTSAGGSAEISAFAPVSLLTGLSDALGTGTKVLWNRGVRDVLDIFRETSFATDESGAKRGLQQEDFSNERFEGQPAQVRTVSNLDRWSGSRWSPNAKNNRGVRWTGYYIPKTSGAQRFIAVAAGHDAYRLYVDNKLVLEQPSREGQAPRAVDIDCPAGKPVAVRFEYLTETEVINARLGVVPVEEMLQPEAKKIAAMADFAVVSVGFDPETESEGFDRTYRLPPGQDELIKAVLAANPHTIVVVTAGGSVDTSRWLDKTPALLQTWYGGQEAGRALAEVLLGKLNPSGKLPISWERGIEDNPAYPNYDEAPGSKDVTYKEGVFLGYRHYDRSQTKPLFPFGFGLSYTTFAVSNLSVAPAVAKTEGAITVSFDVRNAGQRAGSEVAQVYVGELSPKVPRPVKELKGFQRVTLAPGETKHVSIALDRRAFAYWDVSSKDWKVDSEGKFVIYIGDSSVDLPLKANFQYEDGLL
ncbi:MAG: glycoside hydrolase family 3 C-terminal domain-containing protein [Terriglobia bacterium]|jgi:beta-glucosidase